MVYRRKLASNHRGMTHMCLLFLKNLIMFCLLSKASKTKLLIRQRWPQKLKELFKTLREIGILCSRVGSQIELSESWIVTNQVDSTLFKIKPKSNKIQPKVARKENKRSISSKRGSNCLTRAMVLILCLEWKWLKSSSWQIHFCMTLTLWIARPKISKLTKVKERKMQRVSTKVIMNNFPIKDFWPQEWKSSCKTRMQEKFYKRR